jgi:hypothetical protein
MSDQNELVETGRRLLNELIDFLKTATDEDVGRVFNDKTICDFTSSIIDSREVHAYPKIADFFLANRNRGATVAKMRSAVSQFGSVQVKTDQVTAYVSPMAMQWFEDGVMLLEGPSPYTGTFALYQNGQLKCGVAARLIPSGKEIERSDIEFIDLELAKQQLAEQSSQSNSELDAPIFGLEQLLNAGDSDESKYQRLFAAHPWVLGIQYKEIRRHENLDDENIPDFTGVRVNDSYCDIIELKPPTMKMFRQGGEIAAEFNNAWNQAERYLNFARLNSDYLRRKGLMFDHPKCMLICGYNLSEVQREAIRVKERMNPSIQFLTYNDLLVFTKSTVDFVKGRVNRGVSGHEEKRSS